MKRSIAVFGICAAMGMTMAAGCASVAEKAKAPAAQPVASLTVPAAQPMASATKVAAEGGIAKDTWDWAPAMIEVGKKFKGAIGMVMQVGDSTTRNANAQTWGRTFGHDASVGGYSESDNAMLTWAHAGEVESDNNGWHLAYADTSDSATKTAAKGLTTAGLLAGGPGGLPPLAKLIETYKPQVVVLLVGLIDASKNVDPAEVSANMAKALDTVMESGAIPTTRNGMAIPTARK